MQDFHNYRTSAWMYTQPGGSLVFDGRRAITSLSYCSFAAEATALL